MENLENKVRQVNLTVAEREKKCFMVSTSTVCKWVSDLVKADQELQTAMGKGLIDINCPSEYYMPTLIVK